MKFTSIDQLLNFSWDQVVAGYWHRYPNPKSKHVLTEDVYERRVVGNQLITKKLISKTNPVPGWARRILANAKPCAFVIEESIVDLNTKQFTTYTRNIGLNEICSVDEKCVYSPHPENPAQSMVQRQQWIVYMYKLANSMVSKYLANRMKKNSTNAIHGFEHVLKRLYNVEEDVTKESIKVRAKEFAKSKAESVKTKAENVKSKAESIKSKVHFAKTTACESPPEE